MKSLKKIERVAQINEAGNPSGATVYRVDVTQFELSKLLYESEAFSKIELTAGAKLFLWALCSHYNPKNPTMFPSQATVARKLGVSERTAERATKELKDKGLVNYTTKRVNHYVFSELFFKLVGLADSKTQSKQHKLAANLCPKGVPLVPGEEDTNREEYRAQSGFALQRGAPCARGRECEPQRARDILSGEVGHFVGGELRQNVGLTNNHEQKNNFFKKNSFFKGEFATRKSTMYGKTRYIQPGGKAVPSLEETQELIKKQEENRAQDFNPVRDYTKKEAVNWLKNTDGRYLWRSRIAKDLVLKHGLKEFAHVVNPDIKGFTEV